MEQVITTEKIPIKLWLDDIEKGALEQVKNLANLPFAFKHIAVMPDSHQGYGMPIGGVLACEEAIIPNAVGVDIGYTVAKHYNKMAKKKNESWHVEVPKDLAFFPKDSDEFTDYIDEMNYCIEFALQNRKLMMERAKNAFNNVYTDVEFSNFINKPHNFASWENHFGKDVMVHRKGATRARKGELGMIPGSQGTSSFIVRGKGNKILLTWCRTNNESNSGPENPEYGR